MTEEQTGIVARVAARLGVTEGQVYTLAISLTVAVAAAAAGIPPTLVDRVGEATALPRSSLQPTGADRDAAPTTTTTAVPYTGGVGLPSGGGLPPLPQFPGSGTGGGGGGGTSPGNGSTGGGTPSEPPADPFGTTTVFAPMPEPGAPAGVVVAGDGRVLVASDNGGGRGQAGKPVVVRFTEDGDVEATMTLDAVAEGGGVRGLASPDGSPDVVYAVAAQPAAVLRVDLARRTASTYVAIPDLPSCVAVFLAAACEYTPVDRAPEPRAAAFAPDGALYVADAGQATVWRVAPGGGQAAVFHQAVEYVSTEGLSGIAVDGRNRLVVTVAAAATEAQSGTVYRVPVGEDGEPGMLERVATTERADRPLGVTVGRSGRIYVALAGAGRLLVLGDDGTAVTRLPGGDASPLDTPVGVAFRGRDVLVTVQAPTRPLGGQVVRIAVGDRATRP